MGANQDTGVNWGTNLQQFAWNPSLLYTSGTKTAIDLDKISGGIFQTYKQTVGKFPTNLELSYCNWLLDNWSL